MLFERDFSNGDIPRGIGVRYVSEGVGVEDFVAFNEPPALSKARGRGEDVVVRPRGRRVCVVVVLWGAKACVAVWGHGSSSADMATTMAAAR